MEKDLLKFNENIIVMDNGNIAEYRDEKGNCFTIALAPKYQHIAQLLCNCEYIEADAVQLKSLQYNGDIAKGMEFEKEIVSRPVSKFEITHKEKDKDTIVDHDVEISKIWIVKSGFKLTKSFTKKDDALKFMEEENDKFFAICKGE